MTDLLRDAKTARHPTAEGTCVCHDLATDKDRSYFDFDDRNGFRRLVEESKYDARNRVFQGANYRTSLEPQRDIRYYQQSS